MKTLLKIAVVVIVLIVGIQAANMLMVKKQAKDRVTTIMEGWAAGGTSADGHIQEAVCMWLEGTKYPSDNELLLQASREFDEWRKAKKLHRKIASFEIERVKAQSLFSAEEVHVFVRIEGETYGMKVVEDEPIEWLQ